MKLDGIHALPVQVTRIEVETELRPSSQGFDRPLRRVNVKCDLRGMDFVRELYTALGEHIQNRIPAFGQQLKTRIDPGGRHGREGIQQVPDARTGEAVDDAHSESLRRASGILHRLGCSMVDPFRIPVSPDLGRQYGAMPLINNVQHSLAHEVITDRKDLHVVLLQQFAFTLAVAVVGQRLVDFEMITPAAEFQSVEAKFLAQACHFFQRKIGPLAGAECNGA